MEFELQHVTIPLKEEKKYIHELKHLRYQRDQLTSNLNSSEEIDEAFEHKEQIEEQFKVFLINYHNISTICFGLKNFSFLRTAFEGGTRFS